MIVRACLLVLVTVVGVIAGRRRGERSRAMSELYTYQWILLIPAHTARHVTQMREIKAAPGYLNN